ncbi:MAG: GNAT family N-acetyltransferase [Syntrophobacteraceae bacterium]|nr:GNAT family N-acetyltransferase [Syntrophobacteraceae bacterium]
MHIESYNPALCGLWDEAVAAARNGTFLHRRGFMDYHANRFEDCSLLLLDDKDNVLALLPANRIEDIVFSHGGLTYGGLLLGARFTQRECSEAFERIAQHYLARGIRQVVYKPVPHIFHRCPAEDDLYALYRIGARLVRRDPSSAIDLGSPLPFQKGRKWCINKARKGGVVLNTTSDPTDFHALLTSVLARHGAVPVHNLLELELLIGRFPDSLKLFEARSNDNLMAGILIFDFSLVAHTQYMAVSEEGRELGALDLLIAYLIRDVYASRRYVSLGTSIDPRSSALNVGLIAQKEGFGARTVVNDTYEWDLT